MPNRWMAAVPDALYMVDPSGRVREWSAGAEALYGYAQHEAIGVALEDLIVPPERRAEQADFVRRTLRDGKGLFETLRRRKDGNLIHIDLSAAVAPVETGGIQGIVFSEKDVTALKVLRDARSLEVKFRALLESMPDAIVMVSATGHILYANGQAERLFRYGAEEMRALPIEALLPERFRNSHRGHRAEYFRHPRTRAMGAGLELFGLRKDGSEFPVEISLASLHSEETPVVMSAIRDVSERRRFEQALREKNQELEDANRAKDRFLASMSHELRTPLNAVIGFTGTLLMGLPGALNVEQTRQLEIVRSNARHLLALINDLLHLAKIEAGKLELNVEPADCRSLVQEIAASLRPQARAKGLALAMELPECPLIFRLDQRAFSQIGLNLVGNAIKFTARGAVRIGLTEERAGELRRLRFSVVDSGPGIPEEEREVLFEPFTQGSLARANGLEGTGLGLHLSRRLAERMGGSLVCTSRVGEGSEFVLTLDEARA